MCTKPTPNNLDTLFAKIAKEELYIETLEPRHMDGLDFHEVGVWGLKRALKRAYEAGAASQWLPTTGPKTRRVRKPRSAPSKTEKP